MSAKPATGAGHVPMMRNSLHVPTPADCGGLARNTVLSPGSAGQTSFTAITPAVLVMTRSCGATPGLAALAVALLKFAEPLEDLRPLCGLELGQFGKDFDFAHGGNLLRAGESGKGTHPRATPRGR
jgi:hypothetical protein